MIHNHPQKGFDGSVCTYGAGGMPAATCTIVAPTNNHQFCYRCWVKSSIQGSVKTPDAAPDKQKLRGLSHPIAQPKDGSGGVHYVYHLNDDYPCAVCPFITTKGSYTRSAVDHHTDCHTTKTRRVRKVCSAEGCTTLAHARGICVKHGANGTCKFAECTANAKKKGGHCSKHMRQVAKGE